MVVYVTDSYVSVSLNELTSTIEIGLQYMIPVNFHKPRCCGYTGFTLSIHLSVRPSICPSVDKIVSALYFPQY